MYYPHTHGQAIRCPEMTLPPRQLLDLGRIVAKTLEERALVGPIQPLAVTYDEAGAMLGVSGRTARKWADAGLLTRCNLGEESATPRILASSIRTYLATKAEKDFSHE